MNLFLFSTTKPSLDAVFQAKPLKVKGKSKIKQLIGNPINMYFAFSAVIKSGTTLRFSRIQIFKLISSNAFLQLRFRYAMLAHSRLCPLSMSWLRQSIEFAWTYFVL